MTEELPELLGPGIYQGIPDSEYHANERIGSTTAKLAIKSLQLYRDARTGLYVQPDRPHYQIGRLAHMMILEPKRFAELVTDHGPINERTGKPYSRDTNAYAAWVAANPQITMVEPWLYTMLNRMPTQVRSLFVGGEPEVSVYVDMPNGLQVKCRPDYLRDTLILDVKTIDDIDQVERAITKYKYWFSCAWYRLVLSEMTGLRHPYKLVFCEKKMPHRWRIVPLSAGYMMYGNDVVLRTMDKIAKAQESGDFSDDDEVEFIAEIPDYMDDESDGPL